MKTLNFNDIEWEVLDTPVAQRFAAFFGTNENTSKEFYFMGETETQVKDEIDKLAFMLKMDTTKGMNELHEIFASYREPSEDHSRLNNLIHYHELITNGYPPRWGYMFGDPNAQMVIGKDDYPEFTLNRDFGTLYINYSHVGKHFAEIVFSNGLDIAEEQYQPQEFARPGFMCWLGDTLPQDQVTRFEDKAETVRQKLQDRLGLPERGDPSLRLGYIPFATLKTSINNNELVNQLLKSKGKNKNYTELFTHD